MTKKTQSSEGTNFTHKTYGDGIKLTKEMAEEAMDLEITKELYKELGMKKFKELQTPTPNPPKDPLQKAINDAVENIGKGTDDGSRSK